MSVLAVNVFPCGKSVCLVEKALYQSGLVLVEAMNSPVRVVQNVHHVEITQSVI